MQALAGAPTSRRWRGARATCRPGIVLFLDDLQWADGGPTDKRHGRLLCPKHHARAHDPAYTMAKLPGGKVAFTRRP